MWEEASLNSLQGKVVISGGAGMMTTKLPTCQQVSHLSFKLGIDHLSVGSKFIAFKTLRNHDTSRWREVLLAALPAKRWGVFL